MRGVGRKRQPGEKRSRGKMGGVESRERGADKKRLSKMTVNGWEAERKQRRTRKRGKIEPSIQRGGEGGNREDLKTG